MTSQRDKLSKQLEELFHVCWPGRRICQLGHRAAKGLDDVRNNLVLESTEKQNRNVGDVGNHLLAVPDLMTEGRQILGRRQGMRDHFGQAQEGVFQD